jgi:SAM-dependent methyltransferase
MRDCDACGSADVVPLRLNRRHEYVVDGECRTWSYDLVRCRGCGLGFVDPEPSPEILNTFYPKDYGIYQPSNADNGPISPLKRMVAQLRMSQYLDRGVVPSLRGFAGILIETVTGRTVTASLGLPLQLPSDAAIFDVGFGSGAWMQSMVRLGYRHVAGYDIDASTARTEHLLADGIALSHGLFLNNNYPLGAFDCIRLSHVFEHLIDPIAVLTKCGDMLRPGGILVMDHPCFHSWVVELGLDYSPSLVLPMHLYHHTPESTRLMLLKAGLIPMEVKPFAVPLHFGAMVNNARKAQGKSLIPSMVFQVLGPLYRLFGIATGRGDCISAWAKAPG